MTKHLSFCFLILLAGAGFFTCNGSKSVASMPEDGTTVAMTPVDQGAYCAYTDSANLRITDPEAFRNLWTNMHQHQSPVPEIPAVDFSEYELIATFMGPRPSGGFGVSVEKGVVKGQTAWFSVVHHKPGAGCMTTSAITHPYALMLVEKTTMSTVEEVQFVVRQTVHDCTN